MNDSFLTSKFTIFEILDIIIKKNSNSYKDDAAA